MKNQHKLMRWLAKKQAALILSKTTAFDRNNFNNGGKTQRFWHHFFMRFMTFEKVVLFLCFFTATFTKSGGKKTIF